MTTLIGLSATQNEQKIAGYLSEQLSLRCANFKQPIINMVAALTGCEVQQVEGAQNTTRVPSLDCDFGTLQALLGESLNHIKHDALQNLLQEQLKQQEYMAYLFSGALVRGITTASEAQWVRDRGGLMVHIRHQPAAPKPHEDDVVIQNWRDEKKQYTYLINCIRNHLQATAA